MTTEMWRVVMTYGDVVDVDVTRVTGGPVGDWLARFLDGEGYGESPRSAVLDLCASNRFGAEEILAPGELSAEERVADERARCAAVCREVAAEYEGHAGAVARQCAEAVERGAVERPAGDGAALADITAAVRTERECEEYVREATAECERLLSKSTKWAFDRAKQELARAEASLGDARTTLRKRLDALVVERGAVTR